MSGAATQLIAREPGSSLGYLETEIALLEASLDRMAGHLDARDLATLRQLWAEDARIVDSRGTPHPADDYTWSGRAAILDRYALAVFPAPPPPFAAPPDLDVTRQAGDATAVSGVDRWRFTFAEGRWWLQELAY